MNSDYTQQQSLGGLEKAEQLSLRSTLPPADVEGYRIDELLGQGAFGQVWLAHDLNTGRKVAIKFYIYRGGVNWSLLNREVKHLVSMSTGRYIVQVLGVGWDAEPPHYVMEYLENGSLEDRIRARGSLSVPETVTMFHEIASGLSYAHSKGVLHCDLKPANVMLDHEWRPRLADFGQSRMSDEQIPSLGTLFFMAPEQADLDALPDAAWDVYALGAIAYCMLVGSPPYRTPKMIETLDTADSLPDRLKRYRETIQKSRKPRLHYRRRGADKALCQIIDRCLAADPDSRFENVQQVIGAIESRNRARTRRPLYLMGIVGPILFLLLMFGFTARSIGVAKQESLDRVHQWSLESNQFASELAAQTLEARIGALFRLIQAEAGEDKLRRHVQDLVDAAASSLSTIADGREHLAERDQLSTLPEQKVLSRYISERLHTVIAEEEDGSAAIFNSLFINDARGTNLAIGFADPDELLTQSPVGRNFAYRSYFNGQRADGPKTVPRSEFIPTHSTHMSAAFLSTATGMYKVGISSPIWASGPLDGEPATEVPIGVLVLTINLGDFKLLAGSKHDGEHSRFATLVEYRSGDGLGTLLQHPILNKLDLKTAEGEKNADVPHVVPELLERLKDSQGIIDYLDPVARFEGGEDFHGTWIAAMQQVKLPRDSALIRDEHSKSDLWVLVQERSSFVEEPVTQLGSRLQRESYIAIASVLLVMLVLWFFVFRIGRAAFAGSGGNPFASSDNSTFHSTIISDQ